MFLNPFIVRKNLFGPLFIPASNVPASITANEEEQRSLSVGYHRRRYGSCAKVVFWWNNVLENVQNPRPQKYVLECFWTSSHVFCVNSGFSTEWRDKANCEGVGIGQNVSRSFPFGYYRCWEVNFVRVKWLKLIENKFNSIYIYNSVALSVCVTVPVRCAVCLWLSVGPLAAWSNLICRPAVRSRVGWGVGGRVGWQPIGHQCRRAGQRAACRGCGGI